MKVKQWRFKRSICQRFIMEQNDLSWKGGGRGISSWLKFSSKWAFRPFAANLRWNSVVKTFIGEKKTFIVEPLSKSISSAVSPFYLFWLVLLFIGHSKRNKKYLLLIVLTSNPVMYIRRCFDYITWLHQMKYKSISVIFDWIFLEDF